MVPPLDGPSSPALRARDTWLALLLYAILALVLAYPISFHPATLEFRGGPDVDLAAYLLAWDTYALLHQPWAIFDANIFHPQQLTLAYGENNIGVAFFAAPVIWLTGDPVLAVNVVCLLSSMLCGLGAYVLARRVGLGVASAVLCGVIFECSPPRFFRIGQMHLTSVQWIPFALASLHAYLDRGRRRDLLVAVAFVSLQALSTGHGAVFVTVAVGALLAWRLLLGEPLLFVKRVRDFGLTGVALLLPTALVFLPYRMVQREMGFARDLRNTSLMWESFLASPSHVQMWVLSLVDRLRFNDVATAYLFPGYVPLALVLAAAAWQARRVMARASTTSPDLPASTADSEPTPPRENGSAPRTWRPLLRAVSWRVAALAVDGLALVSGALAVEVFRHGAVKARIGGAVLFSTRTGWRPLLLAAVLVAVRVAMLRSAPVEPQGWARQGWAAWSRWAAVSRWRARAKRFGDSLVRARRRWQQRATTVRNDAAAFYGLLTLLCVWLAIGPPFGIWRFVYWLPGLNLVRVPSRFSILGMLGLAVVAGFGFERISASLRRPARVTLATVVGILMVTEFAAVPLASVPYRFDIPDVDRWLDSRPKPFAVAEVPLPDPRNAGAFERRQTVYMQHSMAHWQKTVHGYHGFRPPLHDALYELMRGFPDEASLTRLLQLDVRYVVVHTDLYEPGEWEPVEARLRQFEPWMRLEHVAGAGRVYSLHRPPEPATPPARPEQNGVVRLTKSAHDTEIRLGVGKTMGVRLDALPSAGYSWQIGACDEAVLRPVGEPAFESTIPSKPGAPGTELLRFRAVAVGTVRLELWYLRPWETNVPPAKIFRVTVHVE